MPDKIELQAMNDHDLIVMAVMQGNQTIDRLQRINGRLENHENRIRGLEGNPNCSNGLSRKQKLTYGGIASAIFALAYGFFELIHLLS